MVDKSFLVEVHKDDVVESIRTIQAAIDFSNYQLKQYDAALKAGAQPSEIVMLAVEAMRAFVSEYTALQERLSLALTMHATKGRYDDIQ